MSITNFIKRVCVQTAVYWGNPKATLYGGFSFDTPIEIPCRWEDKYRLVDKVTSRDILTPRADILLTQAVDTEGYLYLGKLSDFASNVDTTNPLTIEGAYKIFSIETTPLFRSTTEFVYTANLIVYNAL